jgi:pantothenate kinase
VLSHKQLTGLAVAGIPGSGKSTSCQILTELLNQSLDGCCFLMPFDGYHIPLAQLKQMDEKTSGESNYVYRRGAPDTFDHQGLLQALHLVKYGQSQPRSAATAFDTLDVISIPGFDHGIGDPEEGAHVFDRSKHKIAIVEGLYLLLDQDGWEPIVDILDYKLFIQSDVDKCMDRLKIRNLVSVANQFEAVQAITFLLTPFCVFCSYRLFLDIPRKKL